MKKSCLLSIVASVVTFASMASHGAGVHDPSITATSQARPVSTGPITAAGVTVLDFEGLQNVETIGAFYNGGTGGSGSGPGPNHGITFSANSLAIIDSDAGGTGNFGGEPSADTALFFTSGVAATMTVSAGFSGGFSFFYSAVNSPGLVTVYDGPNATGNVLTTLALPLTPANGAPDPNGLFSPFVPIGVSFSGIAQSVEFGGAGDQIAFDNITLGSGTPIGGGTPYGYTPVPFTSAGVLAVLALLLMLCGVLLLRRRLLKH